MDENNVNNSNENGRGNRAQLMPAQPAQPRQPQNLQGLLRFAVEARAPDAPPVQELQPMDNERRAFLARALEEMVTDAVVVLRTGIPVLTDAAKIQELEGKDELTPEIEAVFESILDVIEDLDVANDFCRLGGFDSFTLCYNTRNPELWVNTNNLLAGVCQNFPVGQSLALERGLLNKQLDLLRHPDTKHKDKFIYAISCSVREYDPAARALVALGGCEALVPLLGLDDQRVQTKAACLLYHLIQTYPEAQERISALSLPSTLVSALARPPTLALEHLLLLLKTAVHACPKILDQARTPGLGLKEALDKILVTPSEEFPGAFEEVKAYSLETMKYVFGKHVYDCSEEADR